MALALMILAAAQAATAGMPNAPHWAGPPGATRGARFMSPMGEPFFGVAGEDGLTVWFQQADRNHDGVLTIDEMTADADRFYQSLDLNHDGEIDPDEIAHYETVTARGNYVGASPQTSDQASSGAPDGEQLRGHGGGHGGGGHGGGHWGGGRGGPRGDSPGGFDGFGGDDEAAAGRYGLLQIPEPVASADADLNRGVTLAEFRTAAAKRFQLLDVDHTGRLTLAKLESIREAAASEARRPPSHGSSPDGQSAPDDGSSPM